MSCSTHDYSYTCSLPLLQKNHHKFFGYNHRRSNRLNRGIVKYVRPIISIIFINKLNSNICCPSKSLRTYPAIELMEYAAMNATIVIFHLGGGGTFAFKSGIVNHVSKPVAPCKYGVEYLFTSSVCSCNCCEFSHASREALSLNL